MTVDMQIAHWLHEIRDIFFVSSLTVVSLMAGFIVYFVMRDKP